MKYISGIIEDFNLYNTSPERDMVQGIGFDMNAPIFSTKPILSLKLIDRYSKAAKIAIFRVRSDSGERIAFMVEDPIGLALNNQHVLIFFDKSVHVSGVILNRALFGIDNHSKKLIFASEKYLVKYKLHPINKRSRIFSLKHMENYVIEVLSKIKSFFGITTYGVGRIFDYYILTTDKDFLLAKNMGVIPLNDLSGYNIEYRVLYKYILNDRHIKKAEKIVGTNINSDMYEIEMFKIKEKNSVVLSSSEENVHDIEVTDEVEKAIPIGISGKKILSYIPEEVKNNYSILDIFHLLFNPNILALADYNYPNFVGFNLESILKLLSNKRSIKDLRKDINLIIDALKRVEANFINTNTKTPLPPIIKTKVVIPPVVDYNIFQGFLIKYVSKDNYYKVFYPSYIHEIPIHGNSYKILRSDYGSELFVPDSKMIKSKENHENVGKPVRFKLISHPKSIFPYEEPGITYRFFFDFILNKKEIFRKIKKDSLMYKLFKSLGLGDFYININSKNFLFSSRYASFAINLDYDFIGPWKYGEARILNKNVSNKFVLIFKDFPQQIQTGTEYTGYLQKVGGYTYVLRQLL